MSRWLQIAVLVLGSCISMGATAEAAKIVVADQLEALMNTQKAKKMIKVLQQELEPDEKQLSELKSSIRSLVDKMKKDSAVMSESQKRKMEKELEDKRVDHRYLAQKLQKRLQDAQEEILKELGPAFKEAAEAVVKNGGYDLVLQKQAVIHAADAIDITAEMTKKFDAM